MKWIEDKPKVAQAYGIWSLARLLFVISLQGILLGDESQRGLVLVSFLLVVITFVLLYRHFMDAIRYSILFRYIGVFVGIGLISNWIQKNITDRTVVIVFLVLAIIFRVIAECWLYSSLIYKQYQSIKNGINWLYVIIMSVMSIVGSYFLSNFYVIVECIAWAIIINLVYKERENQKV